MRPPAGVVITDVIKFQFTHPGKGATLPISPDKRKKEFQFTHLGKGATSVTLDFTGGEITFQFTHPGKGATLINHPLITI